MEFSRREFVEGVGALTAFGMFGCRAAGVASVGEDAAPLVRFGLVTDLHHADIDFADWGEGQYHRKSKARLVEAVKVFNDRREDFVLELGDFKDLARVDGRPDQALTEKAADEIEAVFAGFRGPRYHALGNHDNDILDKDEVLSHFTNTGFAKALPHYSFERGGVTFVVLDANFNIDGMPYRAHPVNWRWQVSYVPKDEIAWLRDVLAAAKGPVVVFVHQLLDRDSSCPHRIRNADEVREVLERSGKVIGVFQGHLHEGGFSEVNGISYYTLRAMVSGECANSYAEVTIGRDRHVTVTGFAKATSRAW